MADVEAYKSELLAAQQQLASQTRRNEGIMTQLRDFQLDNEDLQKKFASAEAEMQQLRELRSKCQTLEEEVSALQHENQKLKSARKVLDADLKETMSLAEASARQVAQLQGSAAASKSRMDEQAMQLRMLKQQLVDMEEEVCASVMMSH